MKKKNKHLKKIRNLVLICAMWASFLTLSTYAWFIGMKTVNVNPFEIEIATTEGLFLSMDGKKWTYILDVKNTDAYPHYGDNTNHWAEEGLIPMSTIGEMDASVSRMKLFEKGSLTTTTGGYRLLASRVDNYNKDGEGDLLEGKGYVVFDLFIKNLSGEAYYEENDPKNEEAIYLTTNSEVVVGGSGKAGSGIENSVRVAFAQIGRVSATTGSNTGSQTYDAEVGAITGITCSDAEVGQIKVTGICRNAQIWEPNDTAHVQNAINWYDTSCRQRTGVSTYSADKCTEIDKTDDTTSTYAISKVIDIKDYVDIYDGDRYNGYTENTKTYAEYNDAIDDAVEALGENPEKSAKEAAIAAAKNTFKLIKFPYFTDTDKNIAGKDRPTFMTLAPNSITKLRVYIYIEGQDIDNYEFASLGAQIKVNFGFTKERYNGEDIDYDNGTSPAIPATPTTDSQ